MADWNGFEPYDGERLLDEVYALAQSLARLSDADHTDPSVVSSLKQLKAAIDAATTG